MAVEIGELRAVDELEPMWRALNAHHAEVSSPLGPLPLRPADEAWRRRRVKYEGWLREEGTFVLVARRDGRAVGCAFVTLGPAHATWESGETMAELQTLSVLPEERGSGVGAALMAAAEERLAQARVQVVQVTTAVTNASAQRFYERHGMEEVFRTYLRRLGR